MVLPNYIVNKSLYIGNCGTENLDRLKIVLLKAEWYLRLLSPSWEVRARPGIGWVPRRSLIAMALHGS